MTVPIHRWRRAVSRRLVVASIVLAGVGVSQDAPTATGGLPAFAPTVAYVQEAEPIVLSWTSASGEAWLDAIGIEVDPALALAFSERLEQGVRLGFRLAGSAPITIERIFVGNGSGRLEPVPIGPFTVVPAVPVGQAPLRTTASALVSDGPILRGWRLENVSDAVQIVERLAFAPEGFARGRIVVRPSPSTDPTSFLSWFDAVHADLVAAEAPDGRVAPEVLAAQLRELVGDEALVEPSAADVRVAPGEAIDVLLLRSNVAVDLRTTRVLLDALLSGHGPGGAWTTSLSSPIRVGPWP